MSDLSMDNVVIEANKLSATLNGNALHVVADKLVDCFDSSGAVNYLDIAFEHHESKEVYNLTMIKQSGVSQGEVIARLKADAIEKDRMLELAWGVIQDCDCVGHDVELDKYLDDLF